MDLQSHLEAQAAAGRYVDTGSITLNTVKAREKLSRFSLPEPGLWVVKILQAAVAAGAPEIRFEFLRQKVRISFSNAAGWRADQILGLLTSGTLSADRALMHLQVGLSGSTCALSEAVAWSCAGKTIRLLPDSAEAEVNDNHTDVIITAERASRSMKFSERFSSPLRHQFYQTAHEYKALVERAIVSPIPVYLDSYPLPRRYVRNYNELPQIAGFDAEKTTSGMLMAVRPLYDIPDRKHLPYPIVERDWLSGPFPGPDDNHVRLQWWEPEDRPAQAVLALYSCHQRESEVIYVLDGALLQAEKLREVEDTPFGRKLQEALEWGKERFNLGLVVEADPAKVDLSHFQVRRESLRPVLSAALPVLAEMLESLDNWCELSWLFTSLPVVHPKIKDYSLSDIAVTGLIIPLIPVVLGFLALGLVILPVTFFWDPNKARAKDFRERTGVTIQALRNLRADEAYYQW